MTENPDNIFDEQSEKPAPKQQAKQPQPAPQQEAKLPAPNNHAGGQNIQNIDEVLKQLKSNPYLLEQFRMLLGAAPAIGKTPNPYELDLDDTLEAPSVFFSYCMSYACYGDTKFGRDIQNPLNNKPCIFEHVTTLRIAGSRARDDKYIQISQYKTWSKKEEQFLLKHRDYNVRFHKTVKQNNAENTELMLAQMEAGSYVSALGQHELIGEYRTHINPEPSQNYDLMKTALYEFSVKRILKEHQNARQAVVERTARDINMLEKQTA